MPAPQQQYAQSTRALRIMRSTIFDYDDTPKEAQADRVLHYLKQRKMRDIVRAKRRQPVGPYSGLTRGELRATGTCETDWY